MTKTRKSRRTRTRTRKGGDSLLESTQHVASDTASSISSGTQSALSSLDEVSGKAMGSLSNVATSASDYIKNLFSNEKEKQSGGSKKRREHSSSVKSLYSLLFGKNKTHKHKRGRKGGSCSTNKVMPFGSEVWSNQAPFPGAVGGSAAVPFSSGVWSNPQTAGRRKRRRKHHR